METNQDYAKITLVAKGNKDRIRDNSKEEIGPNEYYICKGTVGFIKRF